LYQDYVQNVSLEDKQTFKKRILCEMQAQGVPPDILVAIDDEAVCAILCISSGLASPLDFSRAFKQTWVNLVLWARNNGYPNAH
jgi:hypothetical protein